MANTTSTILDMVILVETVLLLVLIARVKAKSDEIKSYLEARNSKPE